MTCPMREIGSSQEHCPYDWLAVYDGRDEHAPLIGKFCGMGKFPFSIIGTSQYMYVEFITSPAGPLLNTGFHFNVGNWPGHVDTAGIKTGPCNWLLSSEQLRKTSASEGIFLSIAHWYPPDTSCNYHIQGNPGEIVRLYFPSFRINRIEAAIKKYDSDCSESLTIYDSDRPDPSRIIKTFCDTFSRPMEKIDFISTKNSLFIKFNSKTGSYSGSSLYYWAHYDFFNNTKFGEVQPNTLCDEIFYPWRLVSGKIRSPLNTLIFKRTQGSDIRCQYKFVTDKRLYSRVIIEVINISFKDLPFNINGCTRCHDERVDKLVIWEENNKIQNHLACFCDNIPRPVRVISSGEQLNLEMLIQGQHAITSYFKNPNPLFEVNYEFSHGPLCGPITLGPSPDGELIFPYRNALGIPQPTNENKRLEKCIWELKVGVQRDLWLHLDKARFSDRGCDQGRIDVYLAGRLEPRFIICPENISLARDLPILSAAELGALDSDVEPLPVIIQYTGDNTPGRNAFRLVWTELFHLPRNPDGTHATSMLQQQQLPDGGDHNCDFHCPGDQSICIPKHLVCNGILNCPNITTTSDNMKSLIELNLKNLGIYYDQNDVNEKFNNIKYLLDESIELCERTNTINLQSYIYLIIIVAGLTILLVAFCAILCSMCRKKY